MTNNTVQLIAAVHCSSRAVLAFIVHSLLMIRVIARFASRSDHASASNRTT